jgi:hypothetical protein
MYLIIQNIFNSKYVFRIKNILILILNIFNSKYIFRIKNILILITIRIYVSNYSKYF